MTRFAGPVHIDTDCGVDDALALVLVAQLADLQSVTTTWGNCTAAQAAANARHVLAWTRASSVPVTPADTVPPRSWTPSKVHGADGLGGVLNLSPRPRRPEQQTAAEEIVKFARRVGTRGRLLAIAPLTNVAAAARLDPTALGDLDEVVVMAGHGSTPRNAWLDATGDTNTRHDPDSTVEALASKMRMTFVGIDQTREVLLREASFGPTELGRHLLAISQHYGEARADAYGYAKSGPGWRVPAHDATTACVLLGSGGRATTANAPMYVDDSSGSAVLRVAAHAGTHTPRHHFVARGPAVGDVEALIAEALAT